MPDKEIPYKTPCITNLEYFEYDYGVYFRALLQQFEVFNKTMERIERMLEV